MQQISLWHKIDSRARRILPFGLTLIVLLFGLTPTHLPDFAQITPMYALVSVYFWSIYRPDLFGYGSGFGIGILEDLLTGTPLGIGTLTILLTQWVVFNQHKFFHAKPFVVTWCTFVLVALAAASLKWICIGLFEENGFTPFWDLFVAYLVTVTIYPIIAWLFSKAKTGLLEDQ